MIVLAVYTAENSHCWLEQCYTRSCRFAPMDAHDVCQRSIAILLLQRLWHLFGLALRLEETRTDWRTRSLQPAVVSITEQSFCCAVMWLSRRSSCVLSLACYCRAHAHSSSSQCHQQRGTAGSVTCKAWQTLGAVFWQTLCTDVTCACGSLCCCNQLSNRFVDCIASLWERGESFQQAFVQCQLHCHWLHSSRVYATQLLQICGMQMCGMPISGMPTTCYLQSKLVDIKGC